MLLLLRWLIVDNFELLSTSFAEVSNGNKFFLRQRCGQLRSSHYNLLLRIVLAQVEQLFVLIVNSSFAALNSLAVGTPDFLALIKVAIVLKHTFTDSSIHVIWHLLALNLVLEVMSIQSRFHALPFVVTNPHIFHILVFEVPLFCGCYL